MRPVTHVETLPPASPGFIGDGHTAVEVVRPEDLAASDPFVLLMDDRLDIARKRQIGGPHPHAGLETVTFLIEGSLWDRDEGELHTGDVLWMTAGRGIIHNEAVEAEGRSRVLQLWIGLSARDRELAPRFELVRGDAAPVIRADGVEARLYSGAANGVRAATTNRVPTTMLDIRLAARATFRPELPATYNGFFYVLDGAVRTNDVRVVAGQIGWLHPASGVEHPTIVMTAEANTRVVLYAGEPLHEPLVQHGPFVAGSTAEIAASYQRFRAGRFTSMSEVARAQRAEGAA